MVANGESAGREEVETLMYQTISMPVFIDKTATNGGRIRRDEIRNGGKIWRENMAGECGGRGCGEIWREDGTALQVDKVASTCSATS